MTELLTPQQLSDYLKVPVATLYQWRTQGTGPKASRVGRHLRYRLADVDRWVDSRAGTRTHASGS